MFDYDAPPVPATAVADVVAAIKSHDKLPPLSDEELETRRLQREAYRWECDQRREQRRIERERQQQEAEAIARAEAATALAEQNRKARVERQERIDREVQRRTLTDLSLQSAQQRGWINNVESSAYAGLIQRARQATIAEMDGMINPPEPEPEPEPEPVYPENPKIGDSDFYEKWNARRPLRSWY